VNMTDNELVARLRLRIRQDEGDAPFLTAIPPKFLYREAADTIERLTRERDEARANASANSENCTAWHEGAIRHMIRADAAEARIAKLEAALDSFVRDQQSEAQAGTGEYQRGYDDCIADHADRARAALKEPS